MLIKTISDFRKAVRLGPYAWPGGYPLYWLMADGEACAFDVAKTERRLMLEAIAHPEYLDHQWLPIALEINYEDSELVCAHTGKKIESAYAE
jgi:hypothetical protein